IPVAERRAAVERDVAPRAATQDMISTFFRPLRVSFIIFRIVSEPIVAPLQQVAVHVVQSPSIGGKTADRHGFLSILALLAIAINELAIAITEVTIVIRLLRRNSVAEMEGGRRACTTGILPFRLCWQAICLLVFVLLTQLCDKFLAVI